jgi:hypothetical protein
MKCDTFFGNQNLTIMHIVVTQKSTGTTTRLIFKQSPEKPTLTNSLFSQLSEEEIITKIMIYFRDKFKNYSVLKATKGILLDIGTPAQMVVERVIEEIKMLICDLKGHLC